MNENEKLAIKHAKKYLDQHLNFCKELRKRLDGTDPKLVNSTLWAAWFIDQYMQKNFIEDLKKAMINQEIPITH